MNCLENSQTLEICSHEKLGKYFKKRIFADFRVYTTGEHHSNLKGI